MHVYLREEPVDLQMKEVEAEGLVAPDSGLIPMAFFSRLNETPSFRAFLPPETVNILHQVITGPVRLGLMAEEPEVYFITDHYLNYEWVLVNLATVTPEALEAMIARAHQLAGKVKKKPGT